MVASASSPRPEGRVQNGAPRDPLAYLGRCRRILVVYASVMAVALILTATAKLFVAAAEDSWLGRPDPLIGLTQRQVLLLASLWELTVAILVLGRPLSWTSFLLLLWLACAFIGYRLGTLLLGVQGPCPCLGPLSFASGWAGFLARWVPWALLVFLVAGSLWGLRILRQVQQGQSPRGRPSCLLSS